MNRKYLLIVGLFVVAPFVVFTQALDSMLAVYKENYQQKPIKWVRVHNLGDFAYFNHAQHVTVAGLACQKCHGPVETMEDLYQFSPLTMGWCIECHGEKEISSGSLESKNDGYYNEIHRRLMNNDKSLYSKYLEDGKVTVKELGGWECAKCHY